MVVDWSTIDFSKTASQNARKLKPKRLWSVLVCAQLGVPILIAMVYFGAMYLIGTATVNTINIDAVTAYKIEGRKVAHDNMVLYATQARMEVDDHIAAALVARAIEEMGTMLRLNNDMYVGNGVNDVNHAPATVVCWTQSFRTAMMYDTIVVCRFGLQAQARDDAVVSFHCPL